MCLRPSWNTLSESRNIIVVVYCSQPDPNRLKDCVCICLCLYPRGDLWEVQIRECVGVQLEYLILTSRCLENREVKKKKKMVHEYSYIDFFLKAGTRSSDVSFFQYSAIVQFNSFIAIVVYRVGGVFFYLFLVFMYFYTSLGFCKSLSFSLLLF